MMVSDCAGGFSAGVVVTGVDAAGWFAATDAEGWGAVWARRAVTAQTEATTAAVRRRNDDRLEVIRGLVLLMFGGILTTDGAI